jgi:short-subunit dehydrogenase
MELEGRTAVLTGAASGIGRALALELARRGVHLALVDRDAPGLAATAAGLAGTGPGGTTPRVSAHVADLADRGAIRALPAAVADHHPRVDLLINNAGVALGGSFEQVAEADFDWLMAINFEAVVAMTRAFLPVLRAAGGPARIVNVSSLYGLISPPGQTAYSASKFAVRGFSNALRQELRGSPVGVTVVHPGGVATAIARSARVPAGLDPAQVAREREGVQRLLRMPPERAAALIVRGIERDRARVIVGADAAVAAVLERLLPVRHWGVIERLMGAAARRA